MKRIFTTMALLSLVACSEVELDDQDKEAETSSFQISCDESLFIINPHEFYNIDGSHKQTVEKVTVKDGLIYYVLLTDESINIKQTLAISPNNKTVYIEKLTNAGKEPLKLTPNCKVLNSLLE